MGRLRDLPLTGRDAARSAEEFEIGVGFAPAHHGELLQGVFDDGAGRLRRALVTLPLPAKGSQAIFRPSHRHLGVLATPELTKVRRAVIGALREFARHPATAKGGWVEIVSDVPRRLGMGSSTSDVTAAIRAVADYHGEHLAPEKVAQLAVQAECAADSIMIEGRVVLFAHREGVVLETFGPTLPEVIVIGVDTDPRGLGVDTLQCPTPDYDDREVGVFEVLRAALRRAVGTGDAALLGRVATASARINQRYLPKPALELLLAECARFGGCGVQVAHSGTVAGVIFDARPPDAAGRALRCRDNLTALGLLPTATIGITPSGPVLRVVVG